ncbi:HNH endonuclease [bacterium]|nr:HNH endonuclease [bacterium]
MSIRFRRFGCSSWRLKYKQFTKTHLIVAATFPEIVIKEIDHIDGNYKNNEIFNLQEVTHAVNIKRSSASEKGQAAAKKAGKTKEKKIWQLDATKQRKRSFSGRNQAARERRRDMLSRNWTLARASTRPQPLIAIRRQDIGDW